MAANFLETECGMPYVSITPMGLVDTASFIREIAQIIKAHTALLYPEGASISSHPLEKKTLIEENYIDQQTRIVSQAAWFSRSIDCQNLTGKKAIVFGDATHAASMTKILAREFRIQNSEKVPTAGDMCSTHLKLFAFTMVQML